MAARFRARMNCDTVASVAAGKKERISEALVMMTRLVSLTRATRYRSVSTNCASAVTSASLSGDG